MRWPIRLARRRPRADLRGTGGEDRPAPNPGLALEGLPVEEVGGVLLLRSATGSGATGHPDAASVAEVARAVRGEAGVTTVVVATGGDRAPSSTFWSDLGAVFDALRQAEVGCVRLVMSGAGDHRRRQPCVAGRIADAWRLDVIAPDGEVLVVPGGTLFVRGGEDPSSGWWRFPPGGVPRPLGRRAPAPPWQEAFAEVPSRTGDCVVQQIPAGVVMRPARSAAPTDRDPCYAVPVDRSGATVLVDAEQAAEVTADEVATVLRSVPGEHRSTAQLAPNGREDLLPLGQSVAELLGEEVVVLTGIPLLPERASAGTAADPARPLLLGTDDQPRWAPFLSAVACGPTTTGGPPAPRPLRWAAPFHGSATEAPGLLRLTDQWQAAATRAGLALGQRAAPRPPISERPVAPDTFTIELGAGETQWDDSVLPAFTTLLEKLGPQVRSRATVLVDDAWSGGQRELNRVAARFGLADVRYAAVPDTTEQRTPKAPAAVGTPAASPAASPPDAPVGSGSAAPSAAVDATDPPDATEPPDASLALGAHSGSATGTGRRPDASPTRREEVAADAGERGSAPSARSVVSSAPPSRPADDAAGRPLTATTASASTVPPTAAPPPSAPPEATAATGSPDGPAANHPARRPAAAPASRAALGHDPATTAPGSDPAPAVPTASAKPARHTPVNHPATGSRAVDPPPTPQRSASPPAGPAEELGSWPTAERTHPFLPGAQSVAADRAAFRAFAASAWEHHSAAVARALTRMPALRGPALDAARTDLVAVHAYLTAEEGPLDHRALRSGLAAGGQEYLAYAACLASGLRRLPSYRGAALRGPGLPTSAEAVPGTGSLLRVAGPVSTLAGASGPLGDGPASCVVWSVTGRRVRQFLDGSGPHDEVVFAPGTAFRVLGTRELAGSAVVLLRELSGPEPDPTGGADRGGDGLGERDRATLARLESALARISAPGQRGDWPDRCRGPLD